MATILQIETATQVCSAAISKDGHTIALKELMASNIHAGSLTLFIQDVMAQSGLQFAELDAVAVSKGPGSYTGLRIGVSTAKGLCYALDKPLIGIDTLQMMAAGYLSSNPDCTGLICPMIDARRMEVFTAVFDQELTEVAPTDAKIIDPESFKDLLSKNELVFIGDGASKCADMLRNKNAVFSDLNFNSAAHMSRLADVAFAAGRFEDVAYFEPFYLKDFVLTSPKKK
ncbi:MAG TPA: tRNA (adenosine(37)-N6)-threonylcarbamoyltransferase complex dimerization subunit type 1 TsaB [Pedobacter sp.]|uniref:tRNA (adenosine(37)-N6)-threonylcarbamoyltransferase complex dimerization subunit type 1 TsaB n=1 Tax=Pedobacter sp. TaxID=1411316 RepID=UPI002C36C49F|nr:tRNA (adenosine(37)-N6)-threonylcarbamoyltransferase complex dimerization subunit type 1 TsaB [Pedobacter sp.]HMI05599.1 tRNA (adenosine(37)-N6)-threonylcarbamoyltransferase complex dimerization subunit type 1 TsaB [Pedobacter sp.]